MNNTDPKNRMKAAVCRGYGPPDVIDIVDMPIADVKEDEILVKVVSAPVNSADIRIRGLNVPKGFGLITRLVMGFSKPKNSVLGTELSGKVEAVGKSVSDFRVGDAVFADCGMKMGAHAQYRVFKQTDVICHAPANLPLENAGAIIFGGATAHYFLYDKAKLQAKEKILINGASGSVGTAAIQLAKAVGAEVTAVCSTKNIELVSSLGADHVIDYTKDKVIDDTTYDVTYDVIMDNVGNLTWKDCKPALNSQGRLLKVVANLAETVCAGFYGVTSDKKMIAGASLANGISVLQALKVLVEKGTYKPIIDDKSFTLANISEAHRYVDSGHKVGSVLVLCEV